MSPRHRSRAPRTASPGSAPAPAVAGQAGRGPRERILAGARIALAKHGLRVTVDQVARSAGVSRRTVFRHFGTHGRLMAAACSEIWEDYAVDLESRPASGTDLRAWLDQAVGRIYKRHANLGALWWDLHREGLPDGELEAWRSAWLRERATNAAHFTRTAWRLAERSGRPPLWLVETFLILLSAFAGFALLPASDKKPEQAAATAARAMHALLRVP